MGLLRQKDLEKLSCHVMSCHVMLHSNAWGRRSSALHCGQLKGWFLSAVMLRYEPRCETENKTE